MCNQMVPHYPAGQMVAYAAKRAPGVRSCKLVACATTSPSLSCRQVGCIATKRPPGVFLQASWLHMQPKGHLVFLAGRLVACATKLSLIVLQARWLHMQPNGPSLSEKGPWCFLQASWLHMQPNGPSLSCRPVGCMCNQKNPWCFLQASWLLMQPKGPWCSLMQVGCMCNHKSLIAPQASWLHVQPKGPLVFPAGQGCSQKCVAGSSMFHALQCCLSTSCLSMEAAPPQICYYSTAT
jgi:hypothetical protein